MDVPRLTPAADHGAHDPSDDAQRTAPRSTRNRLPRGGAPHRAVGTDDLTRHIHSPWMPRAVRTATRERVPVSRSERVTRGLNIVIAASALVLFSPLMLLIAVAIRVSSRGPILYTQIRVGEDVRFDDDRRARTERRDCADRRLGLDRRGRVERREMVNRRSPGRRPAYGRRCEDIGGTPFRIYKFRSMCADAECGSGAVWAAESDARVTAIGALLRRSRLDELPQFINVLRGEMNIVGPRPERPSIFCRLRTEIPEYALRQRTRPGITGRAQISQSYDTCLDDVKAKVGFDLEYLRRRTVWEDVKIMAKTIPVMLFRRGGW